jgi:hypothetical protein
LQEDLKKFVSEPQPPPSGIEIPKEGKAKEKERRVVGDGDDTVVVEDTTDDDDDDETCRTASSCGRGLAVQACLMYLWCQTPRLAWRLAWLRRHGSRAIPPASGWQRSSRSRRPRLRR